MVDGGASHDTRLDSSELGLSSSDSENVWNLLTDHVRPNH